jgi:hypothetical protein
MNGDYIRRQDRSLTLILTDEEAMGLDTELKNGIRTARVQVGITFKDQNGTQYSATRIIKMRVRSD